MRPRQSSAFVFFTRRTPLVRFGATSSRDDGCLTIIHKQDIVDIKPGCLCEYVQFFLHFEYHPKYQRSS